MSVVVYLLSCVICNEQSELVNFYSLAITLSRVYRTDHEVIASVHSLQGWLKQFDFSQAKLIVVYVGYVFCPGDSVKGTCGGMPTGRY